MTLLTKDKVERFGGYCGLKSIYDNRSIDTDCKYYVHAESKALGVFGFYTDKFIIGGPYKGSDVVDLQYIKNYIVDFEMKNGQVSGEFTCKKDTITYQGYKLDIHPDGEYLAIFVEKLDGENPLKGLEFSNLEAAFKAIDWEIKNGKNT